MKKLFASWRSKYSAETAIKTDGTETAEQCPFCIQFSEKNDPKYFILRRFTYNAVMLNRYPYNAGHILILPLEHKKNLSDISQSTRIEMMELITHTVTILNTTLEPAGMNIGLNLGKVAGAGIPAHIHMHILPRWLGDTNFMPTLGKTKVISFDLTEIYEKLKPAFDSLPEHF